MSDLTGHGSRSCSCMGQKCVGVAMCVAMCVCVCSYLLKLKERIWDERFQSDSNSEPDTKEASF